MLCDSNHTSFQRLDSSYMVFWKRQIYADIKIICHCLGTGEVGSSGQCPGLYNMNYHVTATENVESLPLQDRASAGARLSTFLRAHQMHTTRGEA